MKKLRIYITTCIALTIVFSGVVFAKLQTPEQLEKALKALEGVEIPRPVNRNAFGIGEYLDFGVYVALPGVGTIPIMGGHGILEVAGLRTVDSKRCFHLRSKAYSVGFVKLVYPVKDFIESYMDVDSFYPWLFKKNVREGKYRAKFTIKFDQKNHRAIREGVYNVKTYERVQDILSAFYYVRTLNLEPGDTIPLPYHDDGGNYPIKVIVHRRDTVSVPAGRFACLVVEPIIATPGLFQRKGRMFLWITDDEKKMPVMMVSKIPIGSVVAKLLEYKLGDTNWRER